MIQTSNFPVYQDFNPILNENWERIHRLFGRVQLLLALIIFLMSVSKNK
jgi:hypothetical protein